MLYDEKIRISKKKTSDLQKAIKEILPSKFFWFKDHVSIHVEDFVDYWLKSGRTIPEFKKQLKDTSSNIYKTVLSRRTRIDPNEVNTSNEVYNIFLSLFEL